MEKLVPEAGSLTVAHVDDLLIRVGAGVQTQHILQEALPEFEGHGTTYLLKLNCVHNQTRKPNKYGMALGLKKARSE